MLRGDKVHRVEDSEEGTNRGVDDILTITEWVHDSLGGYNISQIQESTSVQIEIVYTAHAFRSSLDYRLFGICIACDSSFYVTQWNCSMYAFDSGNLNDAGEERREDSGRWSSSENTPE